MSRKDHYTCYLTERGGVFEGLCVDLDIGVQGGSMEDARTQLEHAVRTYLAAVMEEAPEHRDRLLSRRTPWTIRASFAARVAFNGLLGHGHDARFALPCPV